MGDIENLWNDLLVVGRKLVAAGLVVGAGGNISARLPGSDEIVISPSGYNLAELREEDLCALGLDGERRRGELRPSSESNMHLAAYRARPDVNVVFHLHPPHSTLLHAIGRPVRLITIDHAYYLRQLGEVPYLPSGTVELADAVAAELGMVDVVLLKHHGCLLVAPAIEVAYQRAVNLEEAARATYRAALLGDDTTVCPPEYLERIRSLEAAARRTYGQH